MSTEIGTSLLSDWIRECARLIEVNEDELCELDSATGDADHGSNMKRGFSAVVEELPALQDDTPANLLKQVGMTLVGTIGGSSGALYGTFFLRMAVSAADAKSLNGKAFADALRAGAQGLVDRSNVQLGDKTLYDALAPAIEALQGALSDGRSMDEALNAAARAAESGRDATAQMVARKGRSSQLGARTLGHTDAGASSMAMILCAAATTLGV